MDGKRCVTCNRKFIVPAPDSDPKPDTRLDALSGIEKEACSSIWTCVATALRAQVGEGAFDRWFSHIGIDRIDSEAIVLTAPSLIYQVWIEENFRDELKAALGQFLKNFKAVIFELGAPIPPDLLGGKSTEGRDHGDDGAELGENYFQKATNMRQHGDISPSATAQLEAGANEGGRDGGQEETLPVHAKGMNGASEFRGFAGSGGGDDGKPGSGRSTGRSVADAELLRKGRAIGLSDRYSMDGFVVGDNNQLSHAAAMAVIEKPSQRYNPLFFYSAPGLGKSHLLHAIGWEILRKNPKARVAVVTGEAFANEFIAALQKNSLVAFRKKYRKLDVLLMDDIQFLGGKDATQEEFFHTFNTLMDDRRQMVLTSDAPPAEIPSLEQRMVSRFHWGMSAEIQAPRLESRIAILRRKRDEWRVQLPDWVVEYVADRIRGNVRMMEGALMRAATHMSLNEEPLTVEVMDELLGDFWNEDDVRNITVDAIIEETANHFDLAVRDLTGRRRMARIAHARQVGMWLSRRLTLCSLKEIGLAFGGRDHGTVLHAVRTVDRKAAEDPALRRQNEYLQRRLKRNGGDGGGRRNRR
jgi:chromosomal replication initiator protein